MHKFGILAALCAGLVACGNGNSGSTSASATAAASSSAASGASVAAVSTTGTHGTVASVSGATTGGTHGTSAATGASSTTGHTATSAGGATSAATVSATGSTGAATTVGAAATTGASTGAGSSTTGGSIAGSAGSTSGSIGGTTGGTIGGTTGGLGDAGCALQFDITANCAADSDCGCGLVCVKDPAFFDTAISAIDPVCELPCTSSTSCLNAASICTARATHVGSSVGNTCTVNLCGDGGNGVPPPGAACDALGNGEMGGTCVPQSETNIAADYLLCLPTGTATTCADDAGAALFNNEDPLFSLELAPGDLLVAPSFSRNAAFFCPVGSACDEDADAGPACRKLCVPDGDGGVANCTGSGVYCLGVDAMDLSWGFCDVCVPAGGLCAIDPDCCDASMGPGVCMQGVCG